MFQNQIFLRWSEGRYEFFIFQGIKIVAFRYIMGICCTKSSKKKELEKQVEMVYGTSSVQSLGCRNDSDEMFVGNFVDSSPISRVRSILDLESY